MDDNKTTPEGATEELRVGDVLVTTSPSWDPIDEGGVAELRDEAEALGHAGRDVERLAQSRNGWLARALSPFGLVYGKPRKLTDINAELEPLGVVLVVGHWDGVGEPSPTTLELMTPAEFERRSELVPGPDQTLSGIAAEDAQVSVIPMENGRGVKS